MQWVKKRIEGKIISFLAGRTDLHSYSMCLRDTWAPFVLSRQCPSFFSFCLSEHFRRLPSFPLLFLTCSLSFSFSLSLSIQYLQGSRKSSSSSIHFLPSFSSSFHHTHKYTTRVDDFSFFPSYSIHKREVRKVLFIDSLTDGFVRSRTTLLNIMSKYCM